MSTKNLTAWFLILGPLSVFAANFLTSILIGQGETPADRIAEMTDQQALTGVFTFLASLGFVFAFIGVVLLLDSMQKIDKAGSTLARIAMIIFLALTALAIVVTMADWASLNAIQNDQVDNAITIQIVSGTLWAGLLFFWGIGFVFAGRAFTLQKRLHPVVNWICVVFGGVFVLLTVLPLDLGMFIFLVFGIMVLNIVAGGIVLLKEKAK